MSGSYFKDGYNPLVGMNLGLNPQQRKMAQWNEMFRMSGSNPRARNPLDWVPQKPFYINEPITMPQSFGLSGSYDGNVDNRVTSPNTFDNSAFAR